MKSKNGTFTAEFDKSKNRHVISQESVPMAYVYGKDGYQIPGIGGENTTKLRELTNFIEELQNKID